MDVAKTLVRTCARAFYDVKHVLVIDALMVHNALRDDDMGHLLGLQTKDLQKLCGKLKEDRMLHVHTRSEPKEGQQRLVSRTYYYVDFRATIDAVKYKVWRLGKDVERKMNKDADTKGYVCPRCHKEFHALDIVTLNMNAKGFECDRCGTNIVDADDSAEVKTSQERLERLMDQLKPIIDLLKMIDEVVVPQHEFEDALRSAIPVVRVKNQLTGGAAPTAAPGEIPYAKAGINSNTTAPLEVTFTSADEKNAEERAAEQAKRNAQAEQNALPVWYTKSTVTGEVTRLGMKEIERKREEEAFLGRPEENVTTDTKPAARQEDDEVQVDAIQKYYASLAARKAQEDEEEEEEEEADEDEDEDEFENIVEIARTGTTTATPSEVPSKRATPKAGGEESDSGSSGSARGAGIMSQPGEGPPTKKMRTPSAAVPTAVQTDEDDEDEDEDEFEDAI